MSRHDTSELIPKGQGHQESIGRTSKSEVVCLGKSAPRGPIVLPTSLKGLYAIILLEVARVIKSRRQTRIYDRSPVYADKDRRCRG